jgi:hypothetical protein
MKLFGITTEDEFEEYVETDFQIEHRESVLENWLENNPDSIVEDGNLLIIGRQVTTNLGSFIDLLAVDRQGDVAIIELKRDRTPRDTLAQAIEYASFAEQLDYEQLEDIFRTYTDDQSMNLAQYHRDYFELAADEAAVFNKDQRIVIMGQRISPEIRQTSLFLRQKGIRATCVEFTFFETDDKRRLLSSDIVVGKEPIGGGHVSSSSLPKTNEKQFVESLDQYGKPTFLRFLEFAKSNSFPIHWGTKGFSMNVDLDGTHVAFCYGYPPHCVFRQSLYTALAGQGGLRNKVDVPEEIAQSLFASANDTGLFQSAGRELKCIIDHSFSQDEIDTLISWYKGVTEVIKKYGLKGQKE